MKSISSRDNPLYKDLKSLAVSSQTRRKAGRTLLDGVHLCQVYLQHCGMPQCCIVSQDAVSHPEVASILMQCQAAKTHCVILPGALYSTLSQVENGVGLLFAIETSVPGPAATLDRSAVLLDGLQDPGNIGSILRSAAAAGIQRIFCSKGTAFTWSPKVLRAGMGAHFFLEIHEDVNLASLIRTSDVAVLATSSHADKWIYDLDLTRPAAWLFGHEGQGVARDLLSLASHQVAIPHQGAIESLNVAASAAVCLFEQLRQIKFMTSRHSGCPQPGAGKP